MLVFSINRHKKSGIYRRFTSRLSIYCVRRLIPVAFATLTAPNQKSGTDHDEIISSAGEHLVGGDGVVGTYQFIQRIGYATNTHIAALVGYETTRNTHSHLILHIPDDETERFLARLDRVDMKCLYGGDRHSHFQLWDGDKGDAYSYVGKKHHPWTVPTVCPGYYNRCRQGRCEWDRVMPIEFARFGELTQHAR